MQDGGQVYVLLFVTLFVDGSFGVTNPSLFHMEE